LIWDHLTLPWQGCAEEAWTAYCRGSLPIGSVITDIHGRILARGRNCIHDQAAQGRQLSGHRLAHAEINAILQIEWSQVDPRSCILYTTTEPCPLCVGAIRMALIGEVHYASRDNSAGSASLFEATPFIQKGNIKVIGPEHTDLEIILVAMLVEFALTYTKDHAASRYEQLTSMVTDGAQLGRTLFASERLHKWKDEGRTAAFVLDKLVKYIQ
jgi:tRNA(adenine34) deaminase